MKTWKIPVVWQEMGCVEVEANTLAQAIEIARDDDGVIPIPDNGVFVDGTWELDCEDEDCIRGLYNDNQKDEADGMDTRIVFKPQAGGKFLYVCDFDERGDPILAEDKSKAFKFRNFNTATLEYLNKGYKIMKE